MLKKTITYEDFNGETVSEEHFFHLSKAELIKMELSHKDGLSEAMKKIIAAEDGKAIIEEFEKIILGAYGRRSDDGRHFHKSQELRDEFKSSEAYSTLFMELVTQTDKAVEFINGVMPAGLVEEAKKVAAGEKPALATVPEPETMTKVEFDELSTEKLRELAPKIAAGEIKIVE